MGKALIPLCVATNKEYVYFAANAVRHDAKGHDEGEPLCDLVRSERLPSLKSTTWTLVSTFPSPWSTPHAHLDCDVDSHGVFSLRLSAAGDNMDRHTFDPTTPIVSTGRTVTLGNSTHGEWSRVTLERPSVTEVHHYTFLTRRYFRLEDNRTGKAVETLVYFKRMSDSERPFIVSGEYNETGAYDYTTRSRMFLDHYTNGVITDLQYGDGQVFALLQLGGRDRWDDLHNMTLVHMPFTAPLNRSSTELQITRTQWNTECELRMTYGTTLAVASGKLYYLCQNTDKATAESFTYLYIHDSKTGATQGPWRFDGSYRDLRLVYGSTVLDEGEEGPQFGIVKSQRGHVAIDLRSAGHARLKLFSVLDNAIVSGDLNAYEFSRPCDESCSMRNSAQRMVIIVLTVVVLGVIGICFLIRHRTIKKRRLRGAALGVPSMRMATHRPADEDDMELPPYTERDQNSKAGPE